MLHAQGLHLRGIKVIDFGASYPFARPGLTGGATPEYLPPEIVGCDSTHSNAEMTELLCEQSVPHAVDVWSIGALFLEIASGSPLWFSYKSRVNLQVRCVCRRNLPNAQRR
jgi:serine/threonine protein kinase